MSEKRFTKQDPPFRDEFGCANNLINGDSYICGDSAFTGDRDACDTAIEICKVFNEMYFEKEKLEEENLDLTRKLLGFKLFTDDLKTENKQLKQALRESLQSEGNAVLIKTLDKLFQLNYNQWNRNPFYEDWDETLTLKELRDQYE